jgi:peptidoglycan/LPS O-acetylase OafA/YrhL
MMLCSLQAGRGIAAIAVAAFHLSIMMGLERYVGVAIFQDITRFGEVGVDFFFVLSGFIILMAHHADIGQPRALAHYVSRRAVRLFPVYWVYTLGLIAAVLVFGAAEAQVPTQWEDWLVTLSLVALNDYTPPLSVAWTLFHEIAFYGVFGVLIWSRKAGLLVLAVYAGVALFMYQYASLATRTPWTVYTSAYNLFFVLGMGAFLLYRRPGSGLPELLAGACVLAAALALHPIPGDLSPLLIAIGFALLVAAATKLERNGRVSVPAFMVFLGNASYSIYLTHLPVEGLVLKGERALGLNNAIGPEFVFALTLVVTVAIGCAAYVIVERPLLASLHGLLQRRYPRPQPGSA